VKVYINDFLEKIPDPVGQVLENLTKLLKILKLDYAVDRIVNGYIDQFFCLDIITSTISGFAAAAMQQKAKEATTVEEKNQYLELAEKASDDAYLAVEGASSSLTTKLRALKNLGNQKDELSKIMEFIEISGNIT